MLGLAIITGVATWLILGYLVCEFCGVNKRYEEHDYYKGEDEEQWSSARRNSMIQPLKALEGS